MFENKIHIYFQIVFYAHRGVKLHERKTESFASSGCCLLRLCRSKKLFGPKTFLFWGRIVFYARMGVKNCTNTKLSVLPVRGVVWLRPCRKQKIV